MKGNIMEKCLHCGKGQAKYCEKCYQDLITENTNLQIDRNKLFEYKYYDEQNNLIVTYTVTCSSTSVRKAILESIKIDNPETESISVETKLS